MRYLIFGGYGSGNSGDELLLRGCIQSLRQVHPHAYVTVATQNPELTQLTLSGIEYASVSAIRRCLFRTDLDSVYWSVSVDFCLRWKQSRQYFQNTPVIDWLSSLHKQAPIFWNVEEIRDSITGVYSGRYNYFFWRGLFDIGYANKIVGWSAGGLHVSPG